VEQLLAHRSGIGDYLEEDDDGLDVNDYVLPVPMQELADTEQYLAVLLWSRTSHTEFSTGDLVCLHRLERGR
jgi:hypothetical protein